MPKIDPTKILIDDSHDHMKEEEAFLREHMNEELYEVLNFNQYIVDRSTVAHSEQGTKDKNRKHTGKVRENHHYFEKRMELA